MSTPRDERQPVIQLEAKRSSQNDVPQNKSAGPVKVSDVLNTMLTVAGVTEETMAELTRIAVAKLPQLMSATKKTYFSPAGIPEHFEEDPDNPIQLKATELALKFTQAFKPAVASRNQEKPTELGVHITLPAFYKDPDNENKPIDVTPNT
jgi:hypothetical protein